LTKKGKMASNVIVVYQRFMRLEVKCNTNFPLTENAPLHYFEEVCLTQSSPPYSLYCFEKSRQNLVNFFVQSRKRKCKESLLPYSRPFTFCWQICHLWLLRVSFVAFDLVICGI
jgi:hypothetical protein